MDKMTRTKINIACLQETKLKGSESNDTGHGCQLLYVHKVNNINDIGMVVDKTIKDKIVDIKRITSR